MTEDRNFHYGNGSPLRVDKIAQSMPVTSEALKDAGWHPSRSLAWRSLFGPPLSEEEKATLAAENAVLAAVRAAEAVERKRVREATPIVPLTVDALLGVMRDAWGVDAVLASHMIQPWCDCEEDSEGGIWYCKHHEDTF